MTFGTLGIFYTVFYLLVFLCGLTGNSLIISSVVKFKEMRKTVNMLLANLALADLLFILLSILDAVAFFYGEWKGGKIICKIQGTLIEVSYTVSVLTLAAIAIERYASICKPQYKRRSVKQSIQMVILVWLAAFLFCAVLFYGYTTKIIDNKNQCRNEQWSNQARLIFYITHSFLVYLSPLTLMCLSHYKISKALVDQKRKLAKSQNSMLKYKSKSTHNNNDSDETSEHNKSTRRMIKPQKVNLSRSRVIRLLIVVTSVFFAFWSPFIVIRILMYSQVDVNDYLWKGSQLLIFATAAVNFIIYAFMSPTFRKAFQKILSRKRIQQTMSWSAGDSSYEMSEGLKAKSCNREVSSTL